MQKPFRPKAVHRWNLGGDGDSQKYLLVVGRALYDRTGDNDWSIGSVLLLCSIYLLFSLYLYEWRKAALSGAWPYRFPHRGLHAQGTSDINPRYIRYPCPNKCSHCGLVHSRLWDREPYLVVYTDIGIHKRKYKYNPRVVLVSVLRASTLLYYDAPDSLYSSQFTLISHTLRSCIKR